jgi:hypothetical protein
MARERTGHINQTGTGRAEGEEVSTADKWVMAIGAAASACAAGFWLWASLIPVPDNQDTFIAVLQQTAGLNAIAAGCAAVASLCGVYHFVRIEVGLKAKGK